ncbi:ShlB/FhaC/HecB family hemolysin secretion/activation protein [Piscinibacter sakaiensis]|uniref:ShlB/FhaC/HecB family hemolysin secretion/activation protein n=1 Tax=Piscinibacter sakaiensis TaxID=1547922 RepID=UPI003729FBB0
MNSGLRLAEVAPDAGRVVFDVVEGRLAALRLRGLDGLREGYVRAALLRDDDGPLNVDRLRERFQRLLDDPLFAHLNARLLPGRVPGEAVLEVEVERARPWGLSVFANNHRPVSIGAASMGLAGWLRNLSGHGDTLEATLQAPTDGRGDLRGSLAWRLPLGSSRTQLSLSADEGQSSVVEESVRALDIESRLASREIGLSHTPWETLSQRLSLGVQGAWRENRSWLLGQPFSFNPGEPDGVLKERLGRFWQEYSWRTEQQVLALRSTFVWGRNNLQRIDGLPLADPPPDRFRLWVGQLQFAHRWRDDGPQLVARATVQRSPDRLLALDGLSIGGVQTVRGYRENQLVRDQGEVLNLELEWPLRRGGPEDLQLTLVPFFDHGRGRNHGEPATTLQSAGLALRAGWRGWALELVAAHRIDPPPQAEGLGSNLQDRGIHVQLSYRF